MSKKPLFYLQPAETLKELNSYFFPPYITLAHLFNAPPGWHIKNRVLHQFQLQYVVDGQAEYTIEGHKYHTVKGDLIFHRPGERHRVYTLEYEPYVCLSIVFHFGQTDFPIHELIPSENYLGNFQGQDIERKLTSLVKLVQQPGLPTQLRAQMCLMDILLGIQHFVEISHQQTTTRIQRYNTNIMVRIRNYIHEHFHQEIRIEDLEKLSSYSRDYLIAQFKKTFGMTPIQYQIYLRVEKAKELAVHEGLTPSEIAHRVGYADVHTFGKMFKKKTHLTISQFCKMLFTDNIETFAD